MIFLPRAFSICSICNQVFLSCTKLIEMPFRPKRPVRPNFRRRRQCKNNIVSLTDAVDVGLNVRSFIRAFDTFIHEGKIVVDHHVDLENINSSSDDIGSNQNLDMNVHWMKGRWRQRNYFLSTFSKTIDDGITLCSVFSPMKRCDFVAFSCHPLRYPIRCMSMLVIVEVIG